MIKCSLAIMLIIVSIGVSVGESEPASFELKLHGVEPQAITLSIDTTLPDDTEVMVQVMRLYQSTMSGESNDYLHAYFIEKGWVSQWKTPRQIRTDDAVWAKTLKEKQDQLSRLSTFTVFEVGSIYPQIEIWANAYSKPSMKSEIRVSRPYMDSVQVQKHSSMTSWDGLEAGRSYRLFREATPLMATHPQSGARAKMAALSKTVYLPAGTVIHVEQKIEIPGRWYYVSVPDRSGLKGWVNASALIIPGEHGAELVRNPD